MTEYVMTPAWCKAARAFLGMSQRDLATAANVSVSTVADFEKYLRSPVVNNLIAMQQALTDRGIVFENHGIRKKQNHEK